MLKDAIADDNFIQMSRFDTLFKRHKKSPRGGDHNHRYDPMPYDDYVPAPQKDPLLTSKRDPFLRAHHDAPVSTPLYPHDPVERPAPGTSYAYGPAAQDPPPSHYPSGDPSRYQPFAVFPNGAESGYADAQAPSDYYEHETTPQGHQDTPYLQQARMNYAHYHEPEPSFSETRFTPFQSDSVPTSHFTPHSVSPHDEFIFTQMTPPMTHMASRPSHGTPHPMASSAQHPRAPHTLSPQPTPYPLSPYTGTAAPAHAAPIPQETRRQPPPQQAPYGGGHTYTPAHVPPPPPSYGQPPHHPYHQDIQQGYQDMSASANIGAQNYYGAPPEQQTAMRAPLSMGIAITGIVIVSGLAFGVYKWLSNPIEETPPLIISSKEPFKIRPESPGGAHFPHQDKLIYERFHPQLQDDGIEKLLPDYDHTPQPLPPAMVPFQDPAQNPAPAPYPVVPPPPSQTIPAAQSSTAPQTQPTQPPTAVTNTALSTDAPAIYALQLGTFTSADKAKIEKKRLLQRVKTLLKSDILIQPTMLNNKTKAFRLVTSSKLRSKAESEALCAQISPTCRVIK